MFKRIEFSLNLADPQEARLYRALQPALRYRRGGVVIRQALGLLFAEQKHTIADQTVRDPLVLIQENTNDEQG
ncbi:MAG TPA: hypothetical protein PKD09_19050 [Aggregatilinea sp.]|uniref:hypothetical protein n=1 Tax=Aggregatilinea sp. TaxID=2806333 RepID=UPI002CF9886D|nr:hypothetical protein [Aggregatilinea sp.]HML23762.1 hypothetical protein [Aggregatilinea sp.]